MKDITLDELVDQIKIALRTKDRAEKARVNAEQKKMKANYQYNQLMDIFRAKEYSI